MQLFTVSTTRTLKFPKSPTTSFITLHESEVAKKTQCRVYHRKFAMTRPLKQHRNASSRMMSLILLLNFKQHKLSSSMRAHMANLTLQTQSVIRSNKSKSKSFPQMVIDTEKTKPPSLAKMLTKDRLAPSLMPILQHFTVKISPIQASKSRLVVLQRSKHLKSIRNLAFTVKMLRLSSAMISLK